VRPIIFCEVFADNVEAVSNLLHDHEYQLFDISIARKSRSVLERAAWNTLAYPAERAAEILAKGRS